MVVVRDAHGRVLLVQQNYGLRFYGMPGGKVEPGQVSRQAAVREAAEETGLTVTVGDCVSVENLVYPGGATFRAHVFLAQSVEGEPAVQDSEISSVDWYDLEDLPNPLTPSATAVLPGLHAVASDDR